MQKQTRELVKFEANIPVHLTLETEPSKAKEYKKDTQWGPKVSYGYFTRDNRALFASEALHTKLCDYSKGDTVIITLVTSGDRKVWTVTSSSEPRASNIGADIETASTSVVLRQIQSDIEQIKNKLFDTNEEKIEYPEEKIDF